MTATAHARRIVNTDGSRDLHPNEFDEVTDRRDGPKRAAVDAVEPAYRATVTRADGLVSLRCEIVGEGTSVVVDLTPEAWAFLTRPFDSE